MLEGLGHWAEGMLAAATAPALPKSVLANLAEKAAIVAVGAGIALWANDQRQSDKISDLVTAMVKLEENQKGAIQELNAKLTLIEREGSRPVVDLRARMESIEAQLKVINMRLETPAATRRAP